MSAMSRPRAARSDDNKILNAGGTFEDRKMSMAAARPDNVSSKDRTDTIAGDAVDSTEPSVQYTPFKSLARIAANSAMGR